MAIGDSTVAGVGASHSSRSYPALIFENLRQKYSNAQYYNFGKSGDRTKHLILEQLPKVLELKPDLVTISIGVNDIRGRVKLKNFEKDLTYLVETIQNEIGSKIIINNIPDFSILPTLPIYVRLASRLLIYRFNKSIDKISSKFELTLVDIFRVSKEHFQNWQEYICEDGYHPSDAGYAIWANAIIPNL